MPVNQAKHLKTMQRVPRKIRLGTDYSGLDAPAIALRRLKVAFKTMFASDTSKACRRVLKHGHDCRPHVLYRDVKKRSVRNMASTHLYVWGPPCQPFSSLGKGRGVDDRRSLSDYSLEYLRVHRPRATLMENVKGMLSFKHRTHFKQIVRQLRAMNYIVSIKVLNSLDIGGVRHSRSRIYVAGIQKASMRCKMQWPKAIPPRTEYGLHRFRKGHDHRGRLPSKSKPRERKLVKNAFKKCLAMSPPVDPRVKTVFIDVGASTKFFHMRIGSMPCLTHSRGSTGGFWVSSRGRLTTTRELARMQAILPDDLDWKSANISRRQFGAMLGNTMTVSVVGRVLRNLLWASRLVYELPSDPWAST